MKRNSRAEQILVDMVKIMKELRLQKGFSHETLAQRAGITRPAVSHIEAGKRRPSLMVVLKLAHALEQELSDIAKQSETSCK